MITNLIESRSDDTARTRIRSLPAPTQKVLLTAATELRPSTASQ